MKICFLNIYQNQIFRGAETYVRELSQAFAKKHKVSIFPSNSLPPKRWPVIWRAFIDPQGLYILWFSIKKIPRIWKEKYDIVIPTNGGWQPAIVRLLTWLYGGKMVIIGMSGVGWDDRNNLWTFPDIFIPISRRAQEWAKKANPFVKIKYIPGGVNLNRFKPKGKKFQHKLKKPVVLSVAALTKEKRIDLAIKAISKLKNVSFLLDGRGELKKQIKSLGNKRLEKKFKLVQLNYNQLPQLYRSADLFTIPSSASHSFELVLLEAMASGLPIVANNDPIRKDVVDKAGILVDPTDITSYAQALEKALKTNWGNKPRKQAEKFSWEKIARDYEKLFMDIIRK